MYDYPLCFSFFQIALLCIFHSIDDQWLDHTSFYGAIIIVEKADKISMEKYIYIKR